VDIIIVLIVKQIALQTATNPDMNPWPNHVPYFLDPSPDLHVPDSDPVPDHGKEKPTLLSMPSPAIIALMEHMEQKHDS
jgi:hypothetical protein